MKLLLPFLALFSVPALACEIRLSAKESQRFQSQYDAEQYCQRFSQVGCRALQRGYNDWESVIDFDEIFSGSTRRDAYRNFFNALEQRQLYSYPLNYNLRFSC